MKQKTGDAVNRTLVYKGKKSAASEVRAEKEMIAIEVLHNGHS
jgi:hypothetical protein